MDVKGRLATLIRRGIGLLNTNLWMIPLESFLDDGSEMFHPLGGPVLCEFLTSSSQSPYATEVVSLTILLKSCTVVGNKPVFHLGHRPSQSNRPIQELGLAIEWALNYIVIGGPQVVFLYRVTQPVCSSPQFVGQLGDTNSK
ncbi:hypothetical protein J6590_023455 [Homalodisca vitripennis]|nr:hypothetical protein J6590_023455 [Homalodisca vitripennis]